MDEGNEGREVVWKGGRAEGGMEGYRVGGRGGRVE